MYTNTVDNSNTTTYSIKSEYAYDLENNLTKRNYIQNRLLAQIEWYDKKSINYQSKHKKLSVISTILSATIPIFTLALEFNGTISIIIRFIIAIISSLISIISSIEVLNKYKELWVQYRTNCEILKSVLHRYYTNTGEFNSTDDRENFKILVSSCEDYMTKEFDIWKDTYSNHSKSSQTS